MESIPLAVVDYRDGYTKCQDPCGQEGIIPAMIYNGFTMIYPVTKARLTFPLPKCIIGARPSPVRLVDEVRRGLKHHGEMKWPKSSSAESFSSSRSTTTSTFPTARNRNRSSSRCTATAATKAL